MTENEKYFIIKKNKTVLTFGVAYFPKKSEKNVLLVVKAFPKRIEICSTNE